MKMLPPPGPERWRAYGLLFAILVLAAYFVPGMFSADTPPAAARTPNPTAPGVPGQAASTGSTQSSRPNAPGKKGDSDSPVAVKLAALEPAVDSSGPEAGRNPFRFGEPPKPPPPVYVAPPPLPPPPVYVPPPPPLPQVDLALIGTFLVPNEGLRANFKDKKTGVQFTAVEGGIIDGRYRLIKLVDKQAVVSFLDGTGQRTLRVGG